MIDDAVLDELAVAVGEIDRHSVRATGGGSINRCHSLRTEAGTDYFLKTHRDSEQARAMFAAEAAGLEELGAAHCVRVPRPITAGHAGGAAYLLLEYLPLGGASVDAEQRLGTSLARQHRKQAPCYGWTRDNTIGSTPQVNAQSDDWIEFYAAHRLRFQLDLAAERGFGASLEAVGARLIDGLPAFFDAYRPVPSLLHGDLWGGNWGVTTDGEPVCFDPAVYYGDREADLAMTRLFGGFGPAFYAAYENEWPLDAGFGRRRDLYNLYHVLNHLNLFGRSYLGQAEALLDGLTREL